MKRYLAYNITIILVLFGNCSYTAIKNTSFTIKVEGHLSRQHTLDSNNVAKYNDDYDYMGNTTSTYEFKVAADKSITLKQKKAARSCLRMLVNSTRYEIITAKGRHKYPIILQDDNENYVTAYCLNGGIDYEIAIQNIFVRKRPIEANIIMRLKDISNLPNWKNIKLHELLKQTQPCDFHQLGTTSFNSMTDGNYLLTLAPLRSSSQEWITGYEVQDYQLIKYPADKDTVINIAVPQNHVKVKCKLDLFSKYKNRSCHILLQKFNKNNEIDPLIKCFYPTDKDIKNDEINFNINNMAYGKYKVVAYFQDKKSDTLKHNKYVGLEELYHVVGVKVFDINENTQKLNLELEEYKK